MSDKEKVIEAFKKEDKPLSAGEITKLTGLDRKVVDKVFAELKKEETIISPVRCKWQLK